MPTLLEIRARDAKQLSRYLSGESDRHPYGESGKQWLIPPQCTKSGWDTRPGMQIYSEWGNAAGICED